MLFARLPFSALFCPGAGYRKIRVSEGLCTCGKTWYTDTAGTSLHFAEAGPGIFLLRSEHAVYSVSGRVSGSPGRCDGIAEV